MIFQDKSIQCSDCGTTFTFSAGEQEFFQSKGFINEPKRCPSCRRAKKAQGNDTEITIAPSKGREQLLNTARLSRHFQGVFRIRIT